MASSNVKKPCATCQKGAGVTTCDGCQQSFCIKHFGEHRQELSQQMENIGQEHDLFRRDLDQHNGDNFILSRINTWEQESITKIQEAAEAARADLRELLDKNNKDLKKSLSQFTDELQSCRESDDYTEIDINKWTQQLQEFRKMLESPSTIRIDENKTEKSIIRLVRVCDHRQYRSPGLSDQFIQQRTSITEESSSTSTERFDQIVGKAKVFEEGLVVTCYKSSFPFRSIIYGANRYSSGTHRIHFRIEKIGSVRIFFGITTTSTEKRSDGCDEFCCGWRDLNTAIINGDSQKINDSRVVRTGDEMTLTLDCDNRQIQLQHHQTNGLVQLFVDIDKCPFPWKVAVEVSLPGDSVRILQ